jgi:hypothetical protein
LKYFDEYETRLKQDAQNGHTRTRDKYSSKREYWLRKAGNHSSRDFMDSAAHIKENMIIGYHVF